MAHGGNVWQGQGPGEWLDFSANIRPEGPPAWVRAALRDGARDAAYYPDLHMRREKEALARCLGVKTEMTCPTAGGIAALELAARLDTTGALILTPCFSEYAAFAIHQGHKTRTVSLLYAKHAVRDLACVREALFAGCTVWLCNPLNPVGVAFPREQVLQLLADVECVGGWLVVDEAFIEYCPEHSVVTEVAGHERLLVAGSMTKILGIPGVRLGYLCAQPRVLDGLAPYQRPWELNCFAAAVLRALPEHLPERAADAVRNAQRREMLRNGLEQLGAFAYPSEAAFVLADFARPVHPVAEAMRARGILVRECMDFAGIDDGCHLRLAVKEEAAQKKLLAAMQEVIVCGENP